MRFRAGWVAAVVPCLLAAASSTSQESIEAKVREAKDLLVALCLAGGSETTLSAKGDLDLTAKMRDIFSRNAGVAGRGEVQLSKQEWVGIVGGISRDMTAIQSQQASEARRCMEDKGFDLITKMLTSQGSGQINTSQSTISGVVVSVPGSGNNVTIVENKPSSPDEIRLLAEILKEKEPKDFTKELQQKYSLGFVLFYANGDRLVYYGKRVSGGATIDPAALRLISSVEHKLCLPGTFGTLATGQIVLGGNCFPTNGQPFPFGRVSDVIIIFEPILSNPEGAAWVVGMKPA